MRRLLCGFLIAAMAACSGESPSRNTSCEVVSADRPPLSVALTGSHVEIRDGSHQLIGDSKADKRTYRGDGAVTLEVKAADSGFKVKSAASELLWKVRLEDDKIKVSDNAENEQAWTIKLEAGGEGKVRDPGEHVVGRVLRAASGLQVVNDAAGREAFTVRSGPQSVAYGALLMRGVPEAQRQVIVAELLARGK